MSHHHENAGVIKNYTLTALTSFCIMFFLFTMLSMCHGPFHPVVHHANNEKHAEHSEKAEHIEHTAPAEHH